MDKSRKRGGRGRGSFGGRQRTDRVKKGYLPEELMSHYRRVSETLGQFELGSDEHVAPLDHSKSDFLTNVVSGLAEELVQVSQNQTVSSIIESIIASASPSNLRVLYVAAVTDLSVAFLDRFASHVFEALVLRMPEFFEQPPHSSPEDEEDDVSQDKVAASFEAMCEFVDSQFETLVTHVYGSHVLRALLEALSGVPVAQDLKKTQKSGHGQHSKKVAPLQTPKQKSPETFKTLFDQYEKRLFRVCDYEVHLKDPFFSLMLQAALMILHKADPDQCRNRCQTLLQRVRESIPQSDDPMDCIPDLAQDTAGSHLLEVVFKLCDSEMLQHTFESLLQGNLLYFAIHPTANHVLQKFISFVQDKELMEKVFEELSKHLEDVLAVGYFGVVTSLAEGCRRLRVKQDDFIMTLMEAFHCKEPQERQKSLMKLIATFTAYEVFFSLQDGQEKSAEGTEEPKLTGPVNMHGSLLIQELLQFQKPKHAALGLLDLQPAELQLLCCDPAGSHVVDVFFSSPNVLEKNRDICLRKLKGLIVEIACNKNGSRCLESVWRNLNATQRSALARELAESERLRGDRFGHFLYRNFQLALFTSNRKRWTDRQGAETKRKRMMKELLHRTEPPVKKKKVEDIDASVQKEEHIEDSVTAMFIKQKKEYDARQLLSAQPQAGIHGKSRSQDFSPLSFDSEAGETTQLKKKKKKKDDAKSEKSLLMKSSEHEESKMPQLNKKKKDKRKSEKAMPIEYAGHEESETLQHKKKKKKFKADFEKASPMKFSGNEEGDAYTGDNSESAQSGHRKDKSSFEKKEKKKKKMKKPKSGWDE